MATPSTPCLTVDAHVDLPWIMFKDGYFDLCAGVPRSCVSLVKMKTGGLDSIFCSLYLSDGVQDELGDWDSSRILGEQVRWLRKQPRIRVVSTRGEAENAFNEGLLPFFLGLEGGRLIHQNLGLLNCYRKMGVRYLTLTHNRNNQWADSTTAVATHNGLTREGVSIVKECEKIGVLVDVSHAHDLTIKRVLEVAERPVIATHSGCRKLLNHPRNLPDDLIRGIVATGGIVCVPFVRNFVGSIEGIRAHILHVLELTGNAESVGIGSDMDGALLVNDFNDISDWSRMTDSLIHDLNDHELTALRGGNLLRLLE